MSAAHKTHSSTSSSLPPRHRRRLADPRALPASQRHSEQNASGERTTRPTPSSSPAASRCYPFAAAAAAPPAGSRTPAVVRWRTPDAVVLRSGSPPAALVGRSRGEGSHPAAGDSPPGRAAEDSQGVGRHSRQLRPGTHQHRRLQTRRQGGPAGSWCPSPVEGIKSTAGGSPEPTNVATVSKGACRQMRVATKMHPVGRPENRGYSQHHASPATETEAQRRRDQDGVRWAPPR